MNATSSNTIPGQLHTVLTLAHLLERLEQTAGPVGADQYRSVVQRLGEELSKQGGEPALKAILDAHPAAAELYENMNYRHAGLCRSPLETSMSAEMQAKRALERAARRERFERSGAPGEGVSG